MHVNPFVSIELDLIIRGCAQLWFLVCCKCLYWELLCKPWWANMCCYTSADHNVNVVDCMSCIAFVYMCNNDWFIAMYSRNSLDCWCVVCCCCACCWQCKLLSLMAHAVPPVVVISVWIFIPLVCCVVLFCCCCWCFSGYVSLLSTSVAPVL